LHSLSVCVIEDGGSAAGWLQCACLSACAACLFDILQPPPASSRPCNRFPCPGEVAVWAAGPWSPCSRGLASAAGSTTQHAQTTAPCSPTGTQTRNVTCIRAVGGAVLPDATCRATSPPPDNLTACELDSGAPCNCTSQADCTIGASTQGHWQCDPATHTCVCGPMWAGSDCDVPLVPLGPSASSGCVDGVVDEAGVCCDGFIDAMTGRCCDPGGVLDSRGACCTHPGGVDVCGVCGGLGVAVDALGVCCMSALPPSGVCCVSGVVDSCGVCDGSNACR
jgi:hypothetical protein